MKMNLHVSHAVYIHHRLGVGLWHDLRHAVLGCYSKFEIEIVGSLFVARDRVDYLGVHAHLYQIVLGVHHLGREEEERAD